MTTTTHTEATTPVVDRLFALITHLAKHNRSDLAENVYSFQPTGHGLDVHFHGDDQDNLLGLAATLTDVQVSAKFYDTEHQEKDPYPSWFQLEIRSTIAGMPLRAWTSVAPAAGMTAQSVVDDAKRALGYALAGDSREG